MIPVREYQAFWQYMASQLTSIEKVLIVDDESDLQKKIADIDNGCIILVAVIPSADFNALDEDNFGDIDTCVLYLLQKVNDRDQTDEDIMNERASTQEIMNRIRRLMLDLAERYDASGPVRFMKQVIRAKQHVDRERNYLGCNGYSLSFGIKTYGI